MSDLKFIRFYFRLPGVSCLLVVDIFFIPVDNILALFFFSNDIEDVVVLTYVSGYFH